jgi:hypothetical protein
LTKVVALNVEPDAPARFDELVARDIEYQLWPLAGRIAKLDRVVAVLRDKAAREL